METTKILIEENATEIQAIKRTAYNNVERLNAAYKLEPFHTFDELRKLVADCPRYTRDEMRKDQFTANLMDRNVNVEVPAHLLRRTQILTEALECFDYTRPTKKGFEVDAVAVEVEADKFRHYVTTPYQFKTWNHQDKLLEVLNGYPLGVEARRRNYMQKNDFVIWSEKDEKWIRNNNVLIHFTERDFKF